MAALRRFEDILEKVESYDRNADRDLLRRAYVFSAREHHRQVRKSGEPYLIHPLEVAYILAELRLDTASVAAGLLHDVVEDTLTTEENVLEIFGPDVAHIVSGVTKISKIRFSSRAQAEAENLRKMVLAMVDDVRVILVKLADRLHNMRTLEHLPPVKQKRIARETLEIYAPLANRLGMGRIKSELEDLSLRFTDPEGYRSVRRAVDDRRKVSNRFIETIRRRMEAALTEHRIPAEIQGRVKSLYSIYRKLKAQGIDVDQVYDYVAFRVITREVADCYAALGIIHSLWRPVPGRIKDFIAMPKPNDYRSLHTSVMGETGQPFEIQIRTRQMHRLAEEGIAAHWRYKEGKQFDPRDAAAYAGLRRILDWQQDLRDPREFRELMKVDLYTEDVYAFTPRGKVLPFPRGATPVDFAYAVHTEVGHSCVGAKVRGRIVPLEYKLKNGDIVEILTQPGHHPSRDWLRHVVTSRARSKIRAWLNAAERERSLALGREMVEKELRKFRVPLRTLENEKKVSSALERLGYRTLEDVYCAVGFGKVTAHALARAVAPEAELPEGKEEKRGRVRRVVRRALGLREGEIEVPGMGDAMISLARCCNPIRGDEIVGYVTRGRGVTVHLTGCPNVARLLYDSDRRIDLSWGRAPATTSYGYNVRLVADVEDRPLMLSRVTNAAGSDKTNIVSANAETFGDRTGRVHLVVQVSGVEHLEKVVARIRRVKGVRSVQRVRG